MGVYSDDDWVWRGRHLRPMTIRQEIGNDLSLIFFLGRPPFVEPDYYRGFPGPETRSRQFEAFKQLIFERGHTLQTLCSLRETALKERFLRRIVLVMLINALVAPLFHSFELVPIVLFCVTCELILYCLYQRWRVPLVLAVGVPCLLVASLLLGLPAPSLPFIATAVLALYFVARARAAQPKALD